MTAIVGMALGKRPIPSETEQEFATANFLLPGGQVSILIPCVCVDKKDLLYIIFFFFSATELNAQRYKK